MKISKEYLKKLIKEEIRSALYDDSIKQDIIACFVRAVNLGHDSFPHKNEPEATLYKQLNNLGVNPLKALQMISREEVDPQFYLNATHMHNAMVRLSGEGEEMMIDAFADFPKIDSSKNRDPDPGFMRVPKTEIAKI